MINVQSHNIKAQATWNAPAGRYDEISRSIGDAIEHAVERLRPQTGDHILDLATGTGWGSRIIAQRFPSATVTGVDIADQMLVHEGFRSGLGYDQPRQYIITRGTRK